MKTILALLLSLPTLAFATCEQFPRKNGPVTLTANLQGLEVVVKANFESRKVSAYGAPEKTVTMHTYAKPRFFVDGAQINVNRASAAEIFRALGYESIESTVQEKVGLFDRKPLLDSTLRLGARPSGALIISSEGYVIPFHRECADWVY